MRAIKSVKFLAVSFGISVITFVIDILFNMQIVQNMYAGYPERPHDEIVALLPFLFVTYVIQVIMFLIMFVCIYPARGMKNAVIWGLWGGFFVAIPNMQFFVAVKDTSWTLMGMQNLEGIVLLVSATILLELLHRPQNGSAAIIS